MDTRNNPEPVPPASQMAVLPFLAGVQGLLSASNVANLRLTIHRVMYREGQEFLQQVCPYLPFTAASNGTGGRIFPVNTGIMGAAYEHKKLFRTRRFNTIKALEESLRADPSMCDAKTTKSWVAIPFLGPDSQVVLILYATCETFNFFADEARIEQMVAMANGFCRLHDFLQDSPFANLRNFPLQKGEPNRSGGGLYDVQEPVDLELPRFQSLTSFNYEAAAA
ncbi:hypothetical protein GOD64_28300 [Sinorhizobium medicae]|uniref:hypothetical protein n=1 Tax=Sinorhizobium medicae TaxID=110321 RepID=UPI00299D97C5|nr:hypothetical protein [Sinorhizobium medicae]MDX0722666.1 hypothetical protein [Sinorhizobium medicae]WQO48908.1 hypothetical protein U8C42_30995 [Sinorhizobium medicae]WQO70511.1 hypothetical protein U8C40_38675 [Sinorhizobium medicae]WQO76110.1 hypothetical protein U8C31_30315 [Sinorhizobium medicae]WQO95278.1 hypothetical protein U8C32_29390 [Sinorhizobium medicae]